MQRPTQTRLFLASTAAQISPGPQTNRLTTPSSDSSIRQNDAESAGRKNAASAEIQRARDILRDVLLREDETEEIVLLGKVSQSLNEMACTLDSLAGLQMMFENWGS